MNTNYTSQNNYLNKPSLYNNNHSNKPSLRLVINSFTGNRVEAQNSNDLIQIIEQKKLNVYISEIIDVNQEMVFEKEKSNKYE